MPSTAPAANMGLRRIPSTLRIGAVTRSFAFRVILHAFPDTAFAAEETLLITLDALSIASRTFSALVFLNPSARCSAFSIFLWKELSLAFTSTENFVFPSFFADDTSPSSFFWAASTPFVLSSKLATISITTVSAICPLLLHKITELRRHGQVFHCKAVGSHHECPLPARHQVTGCPQAHHDPRLLVVVLISRMQQVRKPADLYQFFA